MSKPKNPVFFVGNYYFGDRDGGDRRPLFTLDSDPTPESEPRELSHWEKLPQNRTIDYADNTQNGYILPQHRRFL